MRISLIIFISLLLFACREEDKTTESFDVTIHLNRDPGQINPFYATTSLGREVYQYIFTPLADFHPDDLELSPILVESLPESIDTMILGESLVYYDINLKDDAKWSDGKPLCAQDYFFTVQMIKHPLSEISAWKPYFAPMKKLEMSSTDSTALRVYFDADYMLSREVALTTFVMPAHIYDPEGLLTLDGRALISESYEIQDSAEIKVVENTNASVNAKTDVVQLGPYTLTDFQTDEYIILTAKEDYWGADHSDNVFLQQNPQRIIFRIVPDELSAINMARDGGLDFIRFRSSKRFLELKEDSVFSAKWGFYTSQIMQYYYLAMNNQTGPLSDKLVRKAMSHLADVDDYIDNIDRGLGTRTIGHFNPTKSYYNNELEPISYDPEKAKSLLDQAGWKDDDGDGIREKKNGNVVNKLKLDFYITGSELSQKIALLFQEAAKSVGVEINIVAKNMSLIRRENLSNFNFDFAALAKGTDAAPDDPYSMWHSDNAIPGTANNSGYANPEADRYIELIRNTRLSSVRKEAYLKFQELIYEDQPVIFLYSPLQKMIINSRLQAKTTAKRPGYLANSFDLAK